MRISRILDLSVLSSGEKQIVAIFAHLFLDNSQNQIIVIDEPELSLSVPWQRQFLRDIASNKGCGFLFAVTHSPFIYDNELLPFTIDVQLVTSRSVQ